MKRLLSTVKRRGSKLIVLSIIHKLRMLTKRQVKIQGGRMLCMEIPQKPGLPEKWLVGSSFSHQYGFGGLTKWNRSSSASLGDQITRYAPQTPHMRLGNLTKIILLWRVKKYYISPALSKRPNPAPLPLEKPRTKYADS